MEKCWRVNGQLFQSQGRVFASQCGIVGESMESCCSVVGDLLQRCWRIGGWRVPLQRRSSRTPACSCPGPNNHTSSN
eukprot:1950061-Rhodomonas_salina.2